MDEVDTANERADEFTASALRAVLQAAQDAAPSSGVCRSCQSPIEVERLRANPHARLCCECAAEAEVSQKRARRLGV